MSPRRSDRELVELILSYLNEVKVVATEGDLASAIGINSETANKWLELFLLIKSNCPDFQYKKLGRYRIIDKIGFSGINQELSQVKLEHFSGTRFRTTRFETLNTIHQNIRLVAKMLINRLRQDDISDWKKSIKDSRKAFAEIIDVNLNQLVTLNGKDNGFQTFKTSLKTTIEKLFEEIKELQKEDTITPKLTLITLERNFVQKIAYIVHEFEEYEIKTGKKPDYLTIDKDKQQKGFRGSMLAELKVNLDNKEKILKKLNRDEIVQRKEKSKFTPVLKCYSCSSEQSFPIHCTQPMDYENGQLICEICKERKSIPKCSKCDQKLGIFVKEVQND